MSRAMDYFGTEDRREFRRRRPDRGMGATFAPVAPTAHASTDLDPFNQFDDPSTHFLEQIIKQQMGELAQPSSDPTQAGLMDFFKNQIASLSNAAPISFDVGGDFNADNPLFDQFVAQGQKRIGELEQRPFTDAEEAAMRTRTRNDQVIARDAAKRRVVEDAARRGLGESSGVIQEGLQGQEQAFVAADAKAANDLMMYIADQIQQRKDKAAGISASLATAGEQQAARQQAGKIAGGQMKMQGQIAAASANQNRQGQIMGMASMLADMAAQQRGETRARRGDVLSLATLLQQLPVQRLQLMMQVLNGSGGNNVDNLFGNVVSLNNAQQNARNQGNDDADNFLEAMAAYGKYYADRGPR